jgi:hypothetical protein
MTAPATGEVSPNGHSRTISEHLEPLIFSHNSTKASSAGYTCDLLTLLQQIFLVLMRSDDFFDCAIV